MKGYFMRLFKPTPKQNQDTGIKSKQSFFSTFRFPDLSNQRKLLDLGKSSWLGYIQESWAWPPKPSRTQKALKRKRERLPYPSPSNLVETLGLLPASSQQSDRFPVK